MNFFIIVFLLILTNFTRASLENEAFTEHEEVYGNSTSYREGRWIFSSNSKRSSESCSASSGGSGGMNGICLSQNQCSKKRGTAIPGATCSGKRICCSFSVTCPSNTNGNNNIVTVRQSGSHIKSATGTVNQANRNCEIKFPRSSKNVCQVRLDFVEFTLDPPDTGVPTAASRGNCVLSEMSVNAENLQGFSTCGIATGQRLYLHYGDLDLISISINVLQEAAMNPSFDLFATFLPCSSAGKRSGKSLIGSGLNEDNGSNDSNGNQALADELAPPGCDQYYTGTSGTVKSFNYKKPIDPITTDPKDQAQINNQAYTVCVKTPPGAKKIRWQQCGPDDGFSITDSNADGALCFQADDYVDIPGSPLGRYCGDAADTTKKFVEPVESSARPFLMYVHFDDSEIDPNTNRFYSQSSLINPETGCPVGSICVTKNNEVVTPDGPAGSSLPCMSNEGIALGQICMVEPAVSTILAVDSVNYGFCLRYTVLS